jgi:hypothetical protein
MPLAIPLTSIQLHEAILHGHDNSDPSTFFRNTPYTPIDGIWISHGLKIQKGGYVI